MLSSALNVARRDNSNLTKMNTRKIASIALLLFGEVLIIICFLHFGKNLDPDIRALNIVVASLIYCVNFIDFLIPWVNFKDKSQKTIGSIGLRWVFTFFYILFALGAMVIFNLFVPFSFVNQLLVHSGLLFLFLVGLFLAISSSGVVKTVFEEEKHNREGMVEMKRMTREVQLKLDQMPNLPAGLVQRIGEIQSNLRFLSPGNNSEAVALEVEFTKTMKAMYDCLYDLPLNEEKINRYIHDCERIYNDRKQIFSN
jgi:hypothetical protein